MPDITNPQYVKFANERIRPTLDVSESMYQTYKRFQQEFTAYGAGGIPNNDTDLFADGSDTDGRKRMSGSAAAAVKSLVDALVTYFETPVTIGGVTKTRIAWVQSWSVNGQARF